MGIANVDQATSRPLFFTEISEVAQNAVLPFFENLLKCVCFCLIKCFI